MNTLNFIPDDPGPYKGMQFFLMRIPGSCLVCRLNLFNFKNLLVMKLVFVLLIATGMQAFARPTDAQDVTLSARGVPLKEVFEKIGKQTGTHFFYNTHFLKAARPVSVQLKHVPLKQALDAIFKAQPLTYSMVENTVVVKKKEELPSLHAEKLHQPALSPINGSKRTRLTTARVFGKGKVRTLEEVQITGMITDSTGTPLPGVTVYVKNNRSVGTTTDINGRFVLEVPEQVTVVFSMIGFDSQEKRITGEKKNFNIVLKPSANQLNETVVVAFGKQKKEDVVGAVTTINPEELKIPSSNLTTALAGRLSGVIAYQRSGEPGADNADFFIRGVTTFGYKKSPLILIDGIEVTTTDLARLQPDDVESFSIMKDATATSLYGSRAANGVILITTKTGKEGKASISLRLENSVSMPTENVAVADPVTYMRLNNEAVLTRNPLGILPYSNKKIDNTIAGTNPYMYPTTDWRKALFKDYTMNQRANLSVRGGGSVARYYISGSFNQDHGILKVDQQNNFNSNIDKKSYTLLSNVNVNLTKRTELAVKLSGNFDDYTGPIVSGTDLYRRVMQTNPVLFPPYYPKDAEHSYIKHIMFGNYDDGTGNYYLNPYADMVKGYKDYARSTMSAQINAKQDLSFLLDGLHIRALLNVTRYSYFDVQRAYKPFWYQAGSYDKLANAYKLSLLNEESGTEYLSYEPGPRTVSSQFYMQYAADYTHTFNEKHTLNGLFVFYARNELSGDVTDLQSSLPFRNVGLAGRATYSYNSKYYAELNFGYNGSERFYKTNRYGFFPSVGAAWTVSNEPFWNPFKKSVTHLKLRATYGLTGNDAIGSPQDRFLYLSEVNMNDGGRKSVFGRDNGYGRNGISLSRYSNPDITWETATKSNLGLEIGLFDKWDIQLDLYKEHRSNILMQRTATPATMGLSAQPKANIGEAIGKGIDFSLDYNQFFKNSFWIQGRVNFTYAKSKYIRYEEPYYTEAPWKRHVGYSIGQRWGYIAERLFIDDEEARKSPAQSFGEYGGGDIKYYDVNGDGKITSLDQVPIGYPITPEITYGFGFSLGYKQFDLSAFFQGLGRESFWIDARATAPFISDHQLLKVYADDHWSEDNRNSYALWPRLSTTSAGIDNNAQRSTWFMRNGAFLRVKTVEVGYSLPKDLAQRWFMKDLRIYVSGINLLCFSKFKLWDVEMAGNGLGYPLQRVFNLGIKANF